jgi:general secretion pathway protein E
MTFSQRQCWRKRAFRQHATHWRLAKEKPRNTLEGMAKADGLPAETIFSPSVLLTLRLAPGQAQGAVLTLLADETSDRAGAEALAQLAGTSIRFQGVSSSALERALARLHEEQLVESAGGLGTMLLGEEAAQYLSDRRQSRVEMLVRRALDEGASDIHIQPEGSRLLLRLRIDGELRTVETLPAAQAPGLIAQIKVLARLPLAGRRLPQDGRISLDLNGTRADLRVSIVPSIHGEAAVLRLEGGEAPAALEALAMPEAMLASVRRLLSRRGGVLLGAGAPGSGKTAPLYPMMRELAGPGEKLVSGEDPGGRGLDGVNQVPVEKGGMDFSQAIRAMLRHSPDAMMIGEIRDSPTASAAAEAALTGHLVLATIHARDGAEAILRLADLGVPRESLSCIVEGTLSQRLVRLLCPRCAVLRAPAPSLARALGLTREQAARCRAPVGCPACSGTGWRGRAAIFSLLTMTESLRGTVASNAGAHELRRAAEEAGMTPLAHAARALAAEGRTSAGEAAVAAGLAEGGADPGERH